MTENHPNKLDSSKRNKSQRKSEAIYIRFSQTLFCQIDLGNDVIHELPTVPPPIQHSVELRG